MGRFGYAARAAITLAMVLVVCIAASALAQAPDSSASSIEAQGDSEDGRYGKTPDTAIPYRNFAQPYQRYFQERIWFYGTGRDDNSASELPTVRIGFMGPIGDAPDADVGELMLEGTVLAIDQANAAGGYRGTPYELVVRPDLGLWGATSNEMVAFKYEDDVTAVIGSIDGANTHIALRVALKVQTPIVNTGTTDPTLTETNIPWLLRCMADDRQQGYALAHHIYGEAGIESVVAFRVNDRYGRTGIGEFRDASRRLSHPLRAELRWDRGERDFTRQLDRIEQLAPEAVVIWGNALDAAAVVKEMRRRGMPQRIFGSDRLASRSFLDAAGEAAEGIVAAASFDPTAPNPSFERFSREFHERFGHDPDAFAAHAYDGTRILLEAIEKAGPNRARVRDALYEVQVYDGVTGHIELDTTLNDVGTVYLATVRNGELVYRAVDFETSQAQPAVPHREMRDAAPTAHSPDRGPSDQGAAWKLGVFLPLDETGNAVVEGLRAGLGAVAPEATGFPGIELLVRDASRPWGTESRELVDLVFEDEVLAVIGSTERRGTHLAELLASKMHFPVLTLCADDPTITRIPLPWIFCTASRTPTTTGEWRALGRDVGGLLRQILLSGADTRRSLRDALAALEAFDGSTGRFRFDPLGNRVDLSRSDPAADADQESLASVAWTEETRGTTP